jgi:hypothetical protein
MGVTDDEIPHILTRFGEASSDLLQARTLQQRVDRKYALMLRRLPSLLETLCADYRIVTAAGRSVAQYETVYFDTADRQTYHDHRRGRLPRHKVRLRHHLDRRCSFLEIKSKRAGGCTTKARLELPFGQRELNGEARRFIGAHCPIPVTLLQPCVSLTFRRVTLLSVRLEERVTLDWQLEFRAANRRVALSNVAIAEVKQRRYSNREGAVRALRESRIREQRVSKYCLAAACLMPLKMNALKPTLRALEKLNACGSW